MHSLAADPTSPGPRQAVRVHRQHAARQRCAVHARVQVRSILGQVRPDRQTLLFSATLPLKVDRLVRDALTSPVRVTVGQDNAANEDIRQVRARPAALG